MYNSVMMIGRDGAQLLNYRKTHLYGEYESKLFTAGTTLPPVIDYLGVKISLLICYDIEVIHIVATAIQVMLIDVLMIHSMSSLLAV